MKFFCGQIMHDGDGPLGECVEIEAADAYEAAQTMALRLWKQDGEEDEQEDGDYRWVAVRSLTDKETFVAYKVFCRLVREFLTHHVGKFTREQIDGGKIKKLSLFVKP